MSSPEAIGGYFGLEPTGSDRFPHDDSILLSSGRACLEYVLKAKGATRVHLPKYTCDVMLEPLERLAIPHSFYSIDDQLEIASEPELPDGEFLIYTNYFGLKDAYCTKLAGRLGERLILDSAQALFFERPERTHCFYSPRKFIGIPDGGCLYTDTELDEPLDADASDQRYSHLIGRIDRGPEAAYADFKQNDAALSGEPMKLMSTSTRQLLAAIDFERVRQRRIDNFERLHAALGQSNGFAIAGNGGRGPMVYPYLSDDAGLRARLIEQRVFVATYWPNVFQWCRETELEYRLANQLLPLPIDQRYGADHMDRIAALVLA
jgi:hypothetical protein